MTKILRKYNKWLIAIFGSFLMVTFLLSGPQNCSQTDPASMVEGTLSGEKVRARELGRAMQEFEAAKMVAPVMVQNELAIENGVHWMLLTHEAQRLGLIGNAADGRGMLDVLSQRMVPAYVAQQIREENRGQPALLNLLEQNPQFMQQVVDGRLREMHREQTDALAQVARADLDRFMPRLLGESRMTQGDFDMMLAKLRGVTRLVEGYVAAGRMSDKRMLLAARTQAEQAIADVVVLPASSFVNPAVVPDEARLQQQFEAYKAAHPGSGELGFGYAQPARVKLEWMTLSRDAILKAITIDPVEAHKHWQTNRAKYTGEFAAERARLEADLKERRLEDVLSEADRIFKSRVRAQTRKFESASGIKVLPAEYASQRETMASLAQAIVEGVGADSKLELPAPVVTVRDQEWVKVPEAMLLPGIGRSAMLSGSKQVLFGDLLATLQELNPDGVSSTGLQTLVPFESSLTDFEGNRHYFCVLASRVASPADSLDEVRAQVVSDVQEQMAFESLSSELSSLQERAASEGLESLAGSLASRVAAGKAAPTVQRNLRFSSEMADPSLGPTGNEPLRDAILQQLRTLGVMTPATRENQALRTVGVALPARRAVAVAQLNGANAISLERLRTLSTGFVRGSAVRELARKSEGGAAPFSLEALSRRLQWVPMGAERTREEKEGASKQEAPKQDASKQG